MSAPTTRSVVVIGGGPAGLMAAGTIAEAGHRVDLYDAMPSVGRKFLLAGIGGLNLTHSEPRSRFVTRYGGRQAWIAPLLDAFDADTLRTWASDLGIATFVGSSGRVFPVEMKAAPLLRAWLQRLRAAGVRFHVRHRWLGWADESSAPNTGLRFRAPDGERTVSADAVVLALGGASWARLGSDGAWVPWLRARGIHIADLRPANCGFDAAASAARPDAIGWSDHFRQRFAGQALKSIAIRFLDHTGIEHQRAGECMVTNSGLEGSLIYALSAAIRDTIAALGSVEIDLDLAPNRSHTHLCAELARPRGSRSVASHLQSKAGIVGIKAGLLRECAPAHAFDDPARLAALIKALPVRLSRPRPLDEAISTAGGVVFEDVDEHLMIRSQPGLFCCGEMLDWEAPTGGYLLTACIASGHAAGMGVLNRLSAPD
ncbi:TIGR03862 family flavoprotein [Rhodocyclaceae bacterium SMB388]